MSYVGNIVIASKDSNIYTGAQVITPVPITSSSNHIATDGDLSNTFAHTMTENTTLDNPTNLVAGGIYRWVFTQASSAIYTLSFGNDFTWDDGNPYVISDVNNAVDIIEGYFDGTKLRMNVVGKNYNDIPNTAFEFTVKTDNAGVSTSTQFKFPTISGGTYNCVVHWGDGSTSTITTYNDSAWTHTYSSAGTYTIYITGIVNGIFFNGAGDRLKLLNISQWGNFNPGNNGNWFNGCANLTISAVDKPDLTSVTTMNAAFRDCSSLTTIPNFTSWNTSAVTNISSLFKGCTLYNQNFNALNFTSVISVAEILQNASSYNQSISWTLGACNSIFAILQGASSFNSSISITSTINITDARYVFDGASAFNQSVNNINVNNATQLDYIFQNATAFNQAVSSAEGGNWNPTAATSLVGAFKNATSFNKKIIWNLAAATNISEMMRGASAFNTDFTLTGLTSCTNISGLFQDAILYNRADLNSAYTNVASNMSNLFKGALAYNQAISFNTSACTNATSLLEGATSFNSAITSTFANCVIFTGMFKNASAFNQSVSSIDVTNGSNFDYMFQNASSINQDFSIWNPLNITSAVGMLSGITLSNANYNSLLYAFSVNGVGGQGVVTFDGGNSHYDATSGGFDGTTARADLISSYSWSITDGGTP